MAVAGLPRSFNRIRELAKKESTTITLGQLMRSTKSDQDSLIRQAQWLHKQLPIRFARRLNEFFQLPYVIVSNDALNRVINIYLETFDALSDFPDIETAADERAFCDLAAEQMGSHQPVARLVSRGYGEVRGMYPQIQLDEFLNRFFITRISTRILTDNYVHQRTPRPGYIGVVMRDLTPCDIVESLVGDIQRLTSKVYGITPEVKLRGNLACTLDYIPRHVRFMVQELLKNALRATAQRHVASGASTPCPPVVVEFQKGDSHVIIKFSDQGGGMPRQKQLEAWQYGWATAREGPPPWKSADAKPESSGNELAVPKELAGYGFGLPLTRLHAQYFGGDVFMQALPGHGTDMYLLLSHLKEGMDSTEQADPSTTLVSTENRGEISSFGAP
mmetsp:Transcript_9101/g.20081  ORF Transcript_9101/g.20081 Transcript_9101/m.20081 type:complete len:389 (+) Transcript_9101:76-1242(+)